MRSKCKSRTQVGTLTDNMGRSLDGIQDIVNEFNNYFTTVFTLENTKDLPEPVKIFKGPESNMLTRVEFTVTDVSKKLMKLRTDKSGGPDELKPRLLFNVYEEISQPLCYIFNKSMEEGIVPEDWKRANVCPIYKKGNRSLAENYRPVSLTSQVCKVFETLIRDCIVKHLEEHQLLRDTQHGFRKGRSCLTNLLTFLDKVSGCVDDGESVDVIFLDFAKAFDKVPHQRLSSKLLSHGIDGQIRKWIDHWLNGRVQRVGLRGTMSSWKQVTSGVPQGSVLGPVLFLIFINDLEDGITNWILKFADDTKMFGRINNTQDVENMQKDLDKLLQWSVEWQMMFNVQKCKVMHVGKNRMDAEYSMNGAILETVEEEKDLGVVLKNNLKVSSQCAQAYGKASRMLGVIYRTIKYKTKDVMLSLYKSLVRPLLEYCTAAWSPHYVKDRELLERIQHRFTKMIPEIRDLPYEGRIDHLGLWTLEERRNRADLIEVYKMYKGTTKIPFDRFFELNESGRTRGHPLKLRKRRCNTDLRQHFFSERVINRWNDLKGEVVLAPSVEAFKARLTKERSTRMGLFKD